MRVTHIFREANRVADELVNMGHAFSLGIYVFNRSPKEVCHLLAADVVGMSLLRMLRV